MLFQNLTGTVHVQYSTGTVHVISCDPPCKVVYLSLHTTNTHVVNRVLSSLHGGSLEIMLTVPLKLFLTFTMFTWEVSVDWPA